MDKKNKGQHLDEHIKKAIDKEVRKEVKKIIKETYNNFNKEPMNFGDIERELRSKMLNLGGEILERIIRQYGTGYRSSRMKCKCGEKKKFVGNRKKKITTLVKKIEVDRAYYYCCKCRDSEFPLDRRLNTVKTTKSPGVRDAVCLVGAEESFGIGKKFLKELSDIEISKDKIRKLSEKVGSVIEEENKKEATTYYWEDRKTEISQDKLPSYEQIYISADGTCVNTLHGWKEAKSGAVYDAHKKEGKPVRGNTTYVGSFEDSTGFMRRLYVKAYMRGVDKSKRQVALGDGAKWIWNAVDMDFPKATKIVDYYHATERPWDISRSLYGNNTDKVGSFVKPYIKHLDAGRINKIISGFKNIKTVFEETRNKISEAITYYKNNCDKMNYNKFKQEGYFIGSGVVEGSCKHIVAERLKKSGMRWDINNANSILQLRNCILNDRWDDFRRSFIYGG